MAIIVTGATGAFGRAATALLLEKIPPQELILTTRKPEQLADLAARGVRYARPTSTTPKRLRRPSPAAIACC